MGQQQLLLVILVTIIVGIATVVAINTFSSAADSANVDAVRNDLLSMASSAQGYYMKPAMMGGGSSSFDGSTSSSASAITMEDVGCSGDLNSAGDKCTNENGTYTISTGPTADKFEIRGLPSSAGGSIAILVCEDEAVMGDYDPDSETASSGATCPTS